MSEHQGGSILSQTALARLAHSAPAGRGGAAAGRPTLFTTDLGVGDLALLRQAGFEPLGLVMGSSVHHIGYQFQPSSQSRELQVLTQCMYTARQYAIGRMEAEAEALGADGVVGVRLRSVAYQWADELLEFQAVGTAVRATSGDVWRTAAGRPFTSDLSGRDVWLLTQSGQAPVSFVLGTCVYHLAHPTGPMRQPTVPNTELAALTQATYDGREMAMARMQAEAQRDGAVGVVGVRFEEQSHVWGEHAVEFLALGTSVRALAGRAPLPSPSVVIELSDP